MKQYKRHKLQLFHDILTAIEHEIHHNEGAQVAKPTHVQQYSRLSYDKMTLIFGDLRRKDMILRCENSGMLSITSKGRTFLKQYRELMNLIEDFGLDKNTELTNAIEE